MVNFKGPGNTATDFRRGLDEVQKFLVHTGTKFWLTFPVCSTQKVLVVRVRLGRMRSSPREHTLMSLSEYIYKFSSTD
jgi:hypothetical protein